MKYTTHNDAPIDTNGTHLFGYIQATRAQLEVAFGPAEECGGEEDKVTTMWEIQFDNDSVATIYDWKRYGQGAPEPHELESWHIGALSKQAEWSVHEAFRSAHALGAPQRKAA